MAGSKKNVSFIALYLCAFLFMVYGAQMFFNLELAYKPGVEYYRFFTSIFAHSGLEHLTNNMFFIALFGTVYELHTSSRTFVVTFLVSAIFANFAAFVFYPETFILGASAGAMGVLAALAVSRPNQIGIGLGVPMPMWAVLVAYVFIDLVGIGGANSIANEAHLTGILVGAIIGFILREEENREDDEGLEMEDWEKRIREWEKKWMLD